MNGQRSGHVDVFFAVVGREIPADHGYALYGAIARALEESGNDRWFLESWNRPDSDSRPRPPSLAFINPDGEGFHALPEWVDHTDLAETRQQRFSLKFLPVQEGLATAWLKIG